MILVTNVGLWLYRRALAVGSNTILCVLMYNEVVVVVEVGKNRSSLCIASWLVWSHSSYICLHAVAHYICDT